MLIKRLFGSREKHSTHRNRQVAAANRRTTRKLHQKVNVEDVRVGMYVVELDIPWEESDFMLQGFPVESVSDIKALQRQCQYVYVDFDSFKPSSGSTTGGRLTQASTRSHFEMRPIEDEIVDATRIHSMTSQTIEDVFKSVQLGADIDGTALRSAVSDCVESIMRNADAAVWLTQLHRKSEATARHSLNVAALSVILGRSLGYSVGQLEDVGICGSLHDIGKTRLPDELLNKAEKLTDAERKSMMLHTRYGRDILLSSKSVMSGSADVAYCHHERPDGNGYPRGLTTEKIPVLASIVAIAETYDAMTTTQPWRPAWSPSDTLKVLYAQRGKQFDDELVIRFIDAIGIFPPGSVVEMSNGEIGIVLSNTGDKLRPRVILILDAQHQPFAQKIVDLSTHAKDDAQQAYRIKTTHRDGSFGIDIGEFQRAGLRFD